jgi:hypothetical protein
MWPPLYVLLTHTAVRTQFQTVILQTRCERDLAGFACHTGQLRECFGCRWRAGARSRWSHDPGRVRHCHGASCRPSTTEPAWPHASGTGMAGALRRTDWSSTPHPTPRDAPPWVGMLFWSLSRWCEHRWGRWILAWAESRYDVIRYGGRTAWLEKSCVDLRLTPDTWAHFGGGDRVCTSPSRCWPSGKGWDVVVHVGRRLRCDDRWDGMRRDARDSRHGLL